MTVFTIDAGSEDKSLCLEHHAVRKQVVPNYATAFERTKAYLESCGYRVESFGVLAEPSNFAAADVTAAIERELLARPVSPKPGFDIRQCLTQPIRLRFVSQPGNDSWDLWLVLEELPATKDGYKIVFDEYSKQFGVARGTTFLGFEGTFVQTLEAIFRL
ncbi:MAG TPA: hypothetical protein VHZ30_03055 [Verrucomicrobiae bacterium]|nr:hypothetical protein [Verrucomicrobiae bacterium]